jgi:hypothetical protein
MIRSIVHKGLKRLYEEDDARGVIAEHVDELRDIVARLDAARIVADMGVPSSQGRVERLLVRDGARKLAGDFPFCRTRCIRR